MLKRLKHKKWQKIIKDSGMFDLKYYLFEYPDVRKADVDPINHYIEFGVNERKNPSAEFSTSFYIEAYNDVESSKINPLVHYILYGQKENRICLAPGNESIDKLKNEEENHNIITKENNIDSKSVFNQIIDYIERYFEVEEALTVDNLILYVRTIDTTNIFIPNIFDAKFYLEVYKDLSKNNVNPLLHYLKHGMKEGRTAYISKESFVKIGKIKFSKNKNTIVFVSHESSATGAPLLGYSIIDELNNKFNIIHIIINKKQETLHQVFIDNCCIAIDNIEQNPFLYAKYLIKYLNNDMKISCVLSNSVVCRPVLQAAYELKLPTLTLVHEFSDYTRPLGSMRQIVEYSDNVVVPATIIKESMYEDILAMSSAKRLQDIPNNIHVLPQGKLPYIPDSHGENDSIEQLKKKFGMDDGKEYKLIVGSGWVQIRKGVDLFVATAKKIKKSYKGNCKFVWVGEGYDPLADFTFGIWLQREIKYSGLGDDFIFLDHQKNLDNIFMLADLFCLTSRMDPFPNVIIDALSHDLPIACFEHTTGSSEFLLNNAADCIVANHLDTDDLAKGIVKLLNRKVKPNNVNKNIVDTKLDFKVYVNGLEKLITKSIDFNDQNIKLTNSLLQSGQFDADYYMNNEETDYDKCFRYVGNTRKGLHDYSPKAGFSHGKWLTNNISSKKDGNSLLNELEQKLETHNSMVILPDDKSININFVYAIHLHLFYIDLADEFVSYFTNLPCTYDLFITTVEQDEDLIKEMFTDCGARDIKVKNVTNIGRDFGPMLFELKEEIVNGKYEVIGHFHSKKSFDINDDSGDRWRKFLLDTLLGDANTSRSILSLFNNQEVGLVFPDDRHVIDMGDNSKYIDTICKMLSLSKIDETPIFPIGNMFWARVEAIKPLFLLDKSTLLQEEPLPYDGSFMHGLERVTPDLIESRKYEYITVYKEGVIW